MKPILVGLSGPTLTASETAHLGDLKPVGVFLFARNCQSPEQVQALIHAAQTAGAGPWVFIDQEGGRVARLKAPNFVEHPSAATLGLAYAQDRQLGIRLAWLQGALIGEQASRLGINAIAGPVLDLLVSGASNVIGDRALSADSDAVTALGRAWCMGQTAAGVASCLKHIPGHGAASVDSHLALPRVALDFEALAPHLAPFLDLSALASFAMPAHIEYSELGFGPGPLTHSEVGLSWLRDHVISPNTRLVSDCLTMGALKGSVSERALKSLAAGMDWVVVSKLSDTDWADLQNLPDVEGGEAPKSRAIDAKALLDEREALLGKILAA